MCAHLRLNPTTLSVYYISVKVFDVRSVSSISKTSKVEQASASVPSTDSPSSGSVLCKEGQEESEPSPKRKRYGENSLH
jgi:hypothetical protein